MEQRHEIQNKKLKWNGSYITEKTNPIGKIISTSTNNKQEWGRRHDYG